MTTQVSVSPHDVLQPGLAERTGYPPNSENSLGARIGRIVEAARQSLPNAQLEVSISITIRDETNTTTYRVPPATQPQPEAGAAGHSVPASAEPNAQPAESGATKPATSQQLKAIREVGTKAFGVTAQQLAERIREQYGSEPEQLTAAQASELYTNLTETARKATVSRAGTPLAGGKR